MDELVTDDTNMLPILKSDVEWAYGILLAVRESTLDSKLKLQVDSFIDHYHRIYTQ